MVAGHPGVFAFEGEGRGVVVEMTGIPSVEAVAAGAIGDAVHFKLGSVHIIVTGCAVLRQVGKAAIGFVLVALMTFGTGSFCVFAFEGKVGEVVVEMVFALPCNGGVAFVAALAGVVLFGDFVFVHIVVAIGTTQPDIAKMPLSGGVFIGYMAGKARGGEVGAFEREGAPGVVVESKEAGRKALFVVAFGTVRREGSAFGKFAVVVVFVALGTSAVG